MDQKDLSIFFEISSNLLCIMSINGTLLRVNKAWARVFGISPDRIQGNNFKDYFLSEDIPTIFADTKWTAGEKQEINFTGRLKQRKEGNAYFDWTIQLFDKKIYATGVDITKQLDFEFVSNNQKEQFELILRGSNDGIWDWNIVTNEVYLSPKWKKQLGYEDSELENKYGTVKFLMHPDDREIFEAKLKSFIESRSNMFSAEYRMKHKNGSYRWIWARGAAIRDENGIACRLAGSHTDITKSKEMIKNIRENEKYLKRILDTARDGFAVVRNNKIEDTNLALSTMCGYSKEELASMTLSDLVAEENKQEFQAIRERLYKEGYIICEITSKKKDGTKINVEVTATVIDRENVASALFIRDITERKNTQNRLLHFHELIKYIIEHNRIAVSVHDKDVNFMYVSQPYIDLFKLQGKEIIGKNLYDVQSRMPEAYREIHQRVLKGEIIRNEDTRSVFYEGRFVRWECRPWYEYDDSVGGFVLYIEDISEQKLLEEQLISEKEHFKTTLLSVGDGVIATDKLGNITVMNQKAENITGRTLNEVAGKLFNDIFRIINEHTESIDDIDFLSVLNSGNIMEYNNKMLISKTGNIVPVEITVAPIKHSDEIIEGAVIVLRDVTEKRTEQRQIEFLSFNDVLTGLFNRRYIENAILQLDTAENLPIALFSIDVNGLKLTNDAFGHEVGDQLLKTVAVILKTVCGSDYTIGRMGGDEFCILMRQTNDEQAARLKERILEEISKIEIYPVIVSLAIGFAVKYAETEDIRQTMTIADNLMYQDKIKYGKIMRTQTIQMVQKNINLKYEHEKERTERVSIYSEAIAKAMNLSEKEIEDSKMAGALHDIGKIMVPPQVLNKTDKLTDEELNQIRRHPVIGYQMLKMAEEYAHLSEYVLYHHERWDGTGFPVGLKGEKIPLISRIVAVANAFEMMTANLPYKKAITKEEAIEELVKFSGSKFDPAIIKVIEEYKDTVLLCR